MFPAGTGNLGCLEERGVDLRFGNARAALISELVRFRHTSLMYIGTAEGGVEDKYRTFEDLDLWGDGAGIRAFLGWKTGDNGS